MMDKIKLKSGITFNSQSNEITGLVPDQLNTKQMMKKILNIEKMKKVGSQAAVYAN